LRLSTFREAVRQTSACCRGRHGCGGGVLVPTLATAHRRRFYDGQFTRTYYTGTYVCYVTKMCGKKKKRFALNSEARKLPLVTKNNDSKRVEQRFCCGGDESNVRIITEKCKNSVFSSKMRLKSFDIFNAFVPLIMRRNF